MGLGRIAAYGHDAIAVFQIVPVVCHRSTSEGSRQPGDRGGVSETGLMFQEDYPQGTGKFAEEIALLVIEARPT